LITGVASGIGLGFTERFLSENNTFIICGRPEELLNEVAAKFPSGITRVVTLLLRQKELRYTTGLQKTTAM